MSTMRIYDHKYEHGLQLEYPQGIFDADGQRVNYAREIHLPKGGKVFANYSEFKLGPGTYICNVSPGRAFYHGNHLLMFTDDGSFTAV